MYPLKLQYYAKTALWGGDTLKKNWNKPCDFDKLAETWELTVRPEAANIIENGALAGSTTNLMTCVQRAISFGIPPRDAFRMASKTPAALMGMKKGEIAVGYDAEFLLLDQNYQLLDVIV